MVGKDSVGNRIRALRAERGVTQAQLAGDRYSHGYISQIESALKEPSLEALEHFAEILDVDPTYLRTGRDPGEEVALELRLQEANSLMFAEGRNSDAEAVLRELRADAADFPDLLPRVVEALASALSRGGDTQRALALYQDAIELWGDAPAYKRKEAVAGVARCHQHLGDPRYGAYLLESYLSELHRDDNPDPGAIARASSSLVQAYFALGMPERAVDAAETARKLEVRITDPRELACMNMNVGRALVYEGRHEEAATALRKTEEIYTNFGWRHESARVLINVSIADMSNSDFDAARAAATEALELFGDDASPADVAGALGQLGHLERLAGNIELAVGYLNQGLALADADLYGKALILRDLGLCGTGAEGERLLDEALAMFRKLEQPRHIADTLRAIAEMREAAGDNAGALAAYKEALDAVGSADF